MLLALIMLTQLDGSPVYVEHSVIYIVNPDFAEQSGQCPPHTGAAITVGSRGLCVRESVKQICEKVERYGGKCEGVR